MLKKLIKYDLLWINKIMLIYFSISIIICILTRISSLNTSSSIGNIIYQILKGVSISCFASVLINSVIRVWVRFRNSIYKDESYLTHTLPISKNTLYNSKILSSIISVIISLLVIIISFIIAFLNKDIINTIKIIFNNNSFIIIGMILTVILEIIYMSYCGIMGILLGNSSNNNKTLKSVFIGISLYFIMQLIILGIIYIIGFFNSDISLLFKEYTSTIMDSSFKTLILIVDILYLIIITILYFIGKKIFNKGVNVE